MRILFMAMALAAATAATAQKIADPRPFANSITPDDLKKHLLIVAGPEMQGRETATEGQRKAAAYIETQFKALGLIAGNSGNFQLGFPIYQDSLVSAGITINGKQFALATDFTINLSMGHTSTLTVPEPSSSAP